MNSLALILSYQLLPTVQNFILITETPAGYLLPAGMKLMGIISMGCLNGAFHGAV